RALSLCTRKRGIRAPPQRTPSAASTSCHHSSIKFLAQAAINLRAHAHRSRINYLAIAIVEWLFVEQLVAYRVGEGE
ncbi:MAG: hypothetical protein MJE77_25225, partial [Proteobacteria bacterium]|nr:hypothetical protein [Pseudomonadota bacterium]